MPLLGVSWVDEGTPPLGEQLRRGLGRFSRAERRVARVLLADYPAAGLTTVASLAARAGVSAPTVVRFTRRLGFGSHEDFRQALRGEPGAQSASRPAQLPRRYGPESPAGRAADVLTARTRETLAALPPDEIRAAVALLADPGHRLLLGGGRFTRLLAHCFALHLMRLRDGTHLLPSDEVELAALLATTGRRDVLVLFDHHRYERSTAEIARHAKNSGAKLLLLTDLRLSPVAGLADVVLPTATDAHAAGDSLVPTLAVVELLVAQLAEVQGEETRSHRERTEQISRELHLL